MGIDQNARRSEPSREHRKAGSGPAETASHCEHIARSCAGAQHGCTSFQIAECRHTHDDRVAAYDVSPDHTCANETGFFRKPLGKFSRPRRIEVCWHAETDQQSGRASTHRHDIGEARSSGTSPDIMSTRPITTKVPTFDENIHGGNHAPIGRLEHSGIVSGTHQGE
jgi:hypothetical protein